MAISLARARRVGQQRTTSKKLAAEYASQQKRASKRKGFSGLLGKGLGMGITAGLIGLTGLTGGLAAPLLGAAGSWLGKKGAHEMTRGMGAETGGLKGDMYGYGEDEAMSLKKDLESQMAVDPSKERGGFGKELLSSYISAGMAGKLGGAKQLLKGEASLGQALSGQKDWAGSMASGKIGGVKGAMAGIGDLFGTKWGGEDAGAGADMPISTEDVYSPLHSQSEQVLAGEEYVGLPFEQELGTEFGPQLPVSQTGLMETSEFFYQQGGQVAQQQQLLALLALAEMQQQNNAYSGTALEEEEQQSTIADMFASQGKTLGGNNTQSLSQMLGR